MKKLFMLIFIVSDFLNTLAGITLTFMMSLIVADVVLRSLNHPFIGTNEIVGLSGALVIGFAVPLTSWARGHVFMDFAVGRLGRSRRDLLNIFTRIVCIILFVFIGYNLFSVGSELYTAGESSPTLEIPLYPFPFVVGVCCFIECFVFLTDILKIREGKYA